MAELYTSINIENSNPETFKPESVVSVAVLCCLIEDNSVKPDGSNIEKNIPYRLEKMESIDLSDVNFSKLKSILAEQDKKILTNPTQTQYSKALGGLNISKITNLIKDIETGKFTDKIIVAIDSQNNVIGIVATSTDETKKIEEIGSFWIDMDGIQEAEIDTFRGKKLAEEMYSLISKTTTKPSIMVTQGLDANPPNYAMLSIAANHNLWILDTKDGSIFQLIKTTDKETGETKFLVSPSGLIKISNWEDYLPKKYKMPKNEEQDKKMYMDEGDYIIFNAKSYSKIFNPDSNE